MSEEDFTSTGRTTTRSSTKRSTATRLPAASR